MINSKIKLLSNSREDAEQFNGREGETATFLLRCFVSLSLRVAVSLHVISAVRPFHLCKVCVENSNSKLPFEKRLLPML
jgi:hypothetical protein